MTRRDDSILILALGNDIVGDDGVALEAARVLTERFDGQPDLDVIETTEGGLGMIDILSPYRRVLLLDSIEAGDDPAGKVREFSRADFHRVLGPCPHYAGLPEVIALAEKLGIDFPDELRVLTIKIDPQDEFRQGLTDEIRQALPAFVDQAAIILSEWIQNRARNLTH